MGKIIDFNQIRNGGGSMTIFDVADYFLSLKSLTPKQIQKLCYYAQAWYYTLNNEPLFNESFEAWVHGPVSPMLYFRYRQYGKSSIPKVTIPEVIKSDRYVNDFLNNIFEQYGSLTGNELELLTHNEDPWLNARGNLKKWDPSYEEITLDSMREYYSKLTID